MRNQNEIEYIKLIIKGETQLFSHFLNTYSRPVFSFIFRIINNREDAEELTQDTFLKAFNKLESFKGECSFSTWLYRIAYNTAISFTRKKKMLFPVIDELQLENITDSSVDDLLNKENNEERLLQLEKAIDLLNAEDRTLINLYYLENKPIADIATISGLSTENVKVKLYRARKKIVILMPKPLP